MNSDFYTTEKGQIFSGLQKVRLRDRKMLLALFKKHSTYKLENKTFSQEKRGLVWCGYGSWAVWSNSTSPFLWFQREIPSSDRENLHVVSIKKKQTQNQINLLSFSHIPASTKSLVREYTPCCRGQHSHSGFASFGNAVAPPCSPCWNTCRFLQMSCR